MASRQKAYLYLLGSAIIWGSASSVIKYTLGGIDPLPFLAYRFLISGLFSLFVIYFFKLKINFKIKDLTLLSVYGFLATTVALGFLFLGLSRTSVIETGLIGAVSPLIVTIGGMLFLKEHVTKREIRGILIALAGALLTVFSPFFTGDGQLRFTGNLFLVLYLISDASAILIAKSMLKQKFKPLLISSFSFLVGAVTIIPTAIASLGLNEILTAITNLPLSYHLGVWYMALISGSLAYFLFIRGERTIEAGEAVLFFYLHPIFSIPIAVFWLNETITPIFIVGALFIAIGVYVAEKKKG